MAASGSRTARRSQPAGVVRLPLDAHTDAVVTLPAKMTGEQWDQMMTVLGAMKPGIVANGHAPAGPDPQF